MKAAPIIVAALILCTAIQSRAGEYHKAGYGKLCSDSENRIRDRATCQAAAASLGLKWGNGWWGPNDFPGCLHARDSRNKVYFNYSPHATNDPSSHPKMANYAEICTGEETHIICYEQDCNKLGCFTIDYSCCNVNGTYKCCKPRCPDSKEESLTVGQPGVCGGLCSSNDDCSLLCPTCTFVHGIAGICLITEDLEALMNTTLSRHDDLIAKLTPSNLADAQALSSSCGWMLWLECGVSVVNGVAKCAGSENVVTCVEQLPGIAQKCWPCIEKAIG